MLGMVAIRQQMRNFIEKSIDKINEFDLWFNRLVLKNDKHKHKAVLSRPQKQFRTASNTIILRSSSLVNAAFTGTKLIEQGVYTKVPFNPVTFQSKLLSVQIILSPSVPLRNVPQQA